MHAGKRAVRVLVGNYARSSASVYEPRQEVQRSGPGKELKLFSRVGRSYGCVRGSGTKRCQIFCPTSCSRETRSNTVHGGKFTTLARSRSATPRELGNGSEGGSFWSYATAFLNLLYHKTRDRASPQRARVLSTRKACYSGDYFICKWHRTRSRLQTLWGRVFPPTR